MAEPIPGTGQGAGGSRQQMGGRDKCYCPRCKAYKTHQRGTPCTAQKCPSCGTSMQPTAAKALEDSIEY